MNDPLAKPVYVVTGSAGLLGTHMVQYLLKNDCTVIALYHTNKPDLPIAKGLELLQADVLDVLHLMDIFSRATHVFHCAGKVSYLPADKEALRQINITGTANVVNACLQANIKKLVHVSSVSALLKTEGVKHITEQMQWLKPKDTSYYGYTKFMGEMEVWRGMEEGLDAAIVNPSIILGYGDWEQGSSKIFKTYYDEFPWYSEGTMGFVGAADVAKAMYLLMQNNNTNGRYIVNAENLPFKYVFDNIAKCFNKKKPYKKITKLTALLAVWLARAKYFVTGKAPLITKETAASAVQHAVYNNEKLLKDIPGFSYTPISRVIEDACAVFKQNINRQ